MKAEPVSKATRISVETSASANLVEVSRWLVACRSNPLRLEADHLPSLGQGSRLLPPPPMSARRAVLYTLWLLEDSAAGPWLLSVQLPFVAHPAASGTVLSV